MCGINGIFAYNSAASAPSEREVLLTRDHMTARGPDGAGLWFDGAGRCGLGHRRLSFQDLDPRAGCPMISTDGTTVLTYNGEIYNQPELRAELEAQGVVYRTTSDTETLVHLYQRHGPAMVHKLRGMFAFGIKPLYYANDGWTYRFASQVKALLAGQSISRTPDPAGTVGFLLYGSVPDPFTLYRDIRALPAGHTQWVDAAGVREPKAYINLASVLAEGRDKTAPSDRAEVIRAAALDSVAHHLIADVEVGVFLSAGIDSGALLGLMRDAGQDRVRGVTLAFDEFTGTEEDESILAAQTARLYGCEHIVRRVGEAEFTRDLPGLIEAMDQPSIDGVNTWFVSKATHEAGLKAALSGVGGDELLGGYPSFRDIPRWVKWLRGPAAVPGLGPLARTLIQTLAPGRVRSAPKLAGMVEYGGDFAGAYLLRRGLFLPFELNALADPAVVAEGLARLKPLKRLRDGLVPDPGSDNGRVTALESANYMKTQLLRDADWAGMAHSLEIRTPLVDIELLRRLAPVIPHLTPGEGKAALAAAPRSALPANVAQRAKTGFVVPTHAWRSRAMEAHARSAGAKGQVSRAWGQEVLDLQAPPPVAKAA